MEKKLNSLPRNVAMLPLEKRALLALKVAVKRAIAERTEAGLPVYVWSKRGVVELSRPSRPRRVSRRVTGGRKARK